jgi:glucan biosynthesis protein C
LHRLPPILKILNYLWSSFSRARQSQRGIATAEHRKAGSICNRHGSLHVCRQAHSESGTSFLNLHLGDFPQYILLFSAGILAARGQWLLKLNFAAGNRWLMVILPTGFAAWFLILWEGGAFRGNGASFAGGWHWQSASLDLWESFTCVAVSFGLLVIYRESLNWQGRIWKFLSDNAFAVYVFHPPIIILVARALHSVVLPSLLKFALLTCIGAVMSFTLSAIVFRRIPLLRRIL